MSVPDPRPHTPEAAARRDAAPADAGRPQPPLPDLVTDPVLVVSPHLDDAVLSAFALLDRPTPIDVLTVFTGSPSPAQRTGWDQFSGFPDSDVAMAARLAENEAAFAGTPHRLHNLGLLDDQYRGRPAAAAEAAAILAWVGGWLDRAGPRPVLAIPAIAGLPVPEPQPSSAATRAVPAWARRGVGKAVSGLRRLRGTDETPDPSSVPPHGHVDHRFVRDTVLQLVLGRPGVTAVLYEELPYLWGRPADSEVAVAAGRIGRPAVPLELRVDQGAKAGRVGCYPTQLPGLFAPLGPLDSADGLPAVERYWVLAGGV